MNKKAQGISMNVIIIAAIALLVLVILSVLVLRSGGELSKGSGCEGVGGVCKYQEEQCPPNFVKSSLHSCEGQNQKCCIPLGTN